MNWRESKAHRAAFIRLRPRVYGNLRITPFWNEWDPPLGEPHKVAVQRWIDEKHYRRLGLIETLTATMSANALRSILSERGLSTFGNKETMARRYATADKKAAMGYAIAHSIWVLTDESLLLQEEFRAELGLSNYKQRVKRAPILSRVNTAIRRFFK